MKHDKKRADFSDPTDLPGHSKIDKRSGFLVAKTYQEVENSYQLTLEKYNILLGLREINKEAPFKLASERRAYKELELMLKAFLIENNCTEDQVVDILTQRKLTLFVL